MAPNFLDKYIITTNYIPTPSRRRPGSLCDTIKFIVAHDTGNPGSSAAANVRYYINTCQTIPKNLTASAHIFVDDKDIIECIPALTGRAEKAWHVLYETSKDNELFGANANDAAIGVEYCYGTNIDPDKAYQRYVWVIAKICSVFAIDPAKCVVGHFFLDPRRKTDPVTGLAFSRRSYDQLLIDIANEYNLCSGRMAHTEPEEIQKAGSVITIATLNIRKQPSRLSERVQQVPAGVSLSFVALTEKGEAVNNNSIWYKAANGSYFWSGGTK